MASSTIDIEFYKDEIISLYHFNKTLKNIVNYLSYLNNVVIFNYLIKYHFKEWKIFKQIKTKDFS